jgi:phosphomevalonate kinase
VWSGQSQNTRPFVAAVRRVFEADPAVLEPVAVAVDRYLDGCQRNDAAEVLLAIHTARDAMKMLGIAAGIDIVSEAHAKIAAIVGQHGGAAKPSGAGGGDVALALIDSSCMLTVQASLAQAGFPSVDVALGVDGVRTDSAT